MARRGRKRKVPSEDKAVFEWEKEQILPENLRKEMETMWELPQLYHFLQLTKEAFNITHLSMYEVERMFLMPKASRQLAIIMTGLLSSPSTTRSKLHKIPPMPYEFWTNILMYKLMSWFKVYQTKRQDPIKTFDTLGIEPEFWTIFPDVADVEGKDFQDFTFRQRVWLVKTVCDTAMYSRKTIQDEISKQPWESQFETVLGMDRYGARYVYFPQFLHNDLRVYKHCLDNKVLSTVKFIPPSPPSVVEEVKQEKVEAEEEITKQEPKPMPRMRRKRRRCRWSNGSLPPKKPVKRRTESFSLLDQGCADSSSGCVEVNGDRSSRCSSKASEISAGSCAKSSGYETNVSTEAIDARSERCADDVNDGVDLQDKTKVEVNANSKKEKDAMDVDETSEVLLVTDDSVLKESDLKSVDDLSKSSKTDDEKLKEISSKNASKVVEKVESEVQPCLDLPKELNVSKSDDEKLSEHKKCDDASLDDSSECPSDELSLDKWAKKKIEDSKAPDSENEISDSALSGTSAMRRSARIRYISEIKTEVEDPENIMEMCEGEDLSSVDLRDSLCRVSSPEENYLNEDFNENDWRVNDFKELISDLSVSSFQLVADSLDSLKDLIEYISFDKTVQGNAAKDNFVRPTCEVNLLKRMKKLEVSLEKVESILKESTKKARCKLQREWSNFEQGVAEEDQEQQDGENGSTNCWLMGPQGCNFEQLVSCTTAEQRADVLSRAALSPVGAEESDHATPADPPAGGSAVGPTGASGQGPEEASSADASQTARPGDGEEGEIKEERAPGQPKEQQQTRHKEETSAASVEESGRTRRVLRARGVSSYTEQLFSDDDSSEEELDGWTDIEAVYAPAGPPADSSAPDAPAKTSAQHSEESYAESDEEDSDQDWILPGSRKRKGKRPSASRRLKSFQHKLQNIQDQSIVAQEQAQQSSPAFQQTVNRRHYRQPTRINYVNTRKPFNAASNSSAAPKAKIVVKTEPQNPNLHSVLDIKDEGPIYDSSPSVSSQQNVTAAVQPNYVVVTTGQAPVTNYYVMQQTPAATAVVQQNQFIQPTTFVSQVPQVQPIQQVQTVSTDGYYVQPNPPQNYIVQNTTGQAFIAATTPVVYQQQSTGAQIISQPQTAPYVQYVTAPLPQQQPAQRRVSQPRIINTTTWAPPRQILVRGQAGIQGNRMPSPLAPGARPSFPHPPNGAVIRSAPIASNALRPGQRLVQSPGVRRQGPRMLTPGVKKPAQPNANVSQGQKKSTCIVLSDSDDEIEMIIPQGSPAKPKAVQNLQPIQPKKSILPPELLERVNDGSVSISPIKPPSQPQNNTTQLVVVVNETGSHYALALPNGSKLILTPEQVAQIRASNGGKLVL